MHFNSMKVQGWLSTMGILWIGAPVGAKRSTGMIEKANDLLERVLKKSAHNPTIWSQYLDVATFDLNCHEIMHLGFLPYEILFGY